MSSKIILEFKTILTLILIIFLITISIAFCYRLKYNYCPNTVYIVENHTPIVIDKNKPLPNRTKTVTYYKDGKEINIDKYPDFFMKFFCNPIEIKNNLY